VRLQLDPLDSVHEHQTTLQAKIIEPIFLLGGFSPDRAESSFLRGFNAIGVRTCTLDVRDLRNRLGALVRNRLGHRLTMGSLFARKTAAQKFNQAITETVIQSRAQSLLVLKGDFVMPETLRTLRRRGVRVALFYPDNPFPPHSSHRPETLPAARETDLYLIWSERLVEKLKDAGVRNPAFLPFAWDPDVFPYLHEQPQGTWPGALFLGGWDKEREQFLEALASRVQLRIYGPAEWGSRTKPSSRVRRCWQGVDLRMKEAAQVVRESAVCINLLRKQHIIDGAPDGLIMRHFEVPGAGGFLLSTRGTGATELFPEGDTGEYFSDVAECAEKVRKYIADDTGRRQFAVRAHAAVAGQHQYADRARQIVSLLNQCV
jgi:spore maturation protein CgeB